MLKSLKQAIKSGIAMLPWGEQFLLWRFEQHSLRIQKEKGCPLLIEGWVATHGWSVQAGPFAGMNYHTQPHGSVLLPKLVGSYEAELHPAILGAISAPVSQVVDIGAAEGFYAVGLARLFPTCEVVAFETSWMARRRMKRLAQANGVARRIRILGTCRSKDLKTLILRNAIVICDCEGAEQHLLDPFLVPGLLESGLLLIELHEKCAPGVTESLKQRFESTHELTLLNSSSKRIEDWVGDKWRGSRSELLVDEWRSSSTGWLVGRRRM